MNTLLRVSESEDRPEDAAPIVVVVVSWNTRELLGRCLASLEPSATSGIAEIWVVDNGSSDGSPEMVRSQHPWVRLVQSGANLGYGPAINLVAARTRSRWLAISNADVRLTAGSLERLLSVGEDHPTVAVVAPRLLLPDGSTQHSVWAFPTIGASIVQNVGSRISPARLSERLALRGAWDPERARRIPWAIGAFLLIRRDAFEQVDGFDEEQWMSAEDLDIGWRLHRAGWQALYEPCARVHHDESSATGQVWGERLAIHWQRCAYAWMVRRMGRPRTVAVGLINFTGSFARLLRLGVRRARGEPEPLRPLARWTLVHAYALAPRRTLARYR